MKHLLALLCLWAVCQAASARDLIVYLSRTQNTQALAHMIQAQTGADLLALETEVPYPENYSATVQQVARENAAGVLPALKTQVPDLRPYNRVFLGFPTWGMQLPPPVKSYLARHALTGKTVIPFNTHAGHGVGSGFTDIDRLCQGCRVLTGLSIQGGVERDGIGFVMQGARRQEVETAVREWLSKLQ